MDNGVGWPKMVVETGFGAADGPTVAGGVGSLPNKDCWPDKTPPLVGGDPEGDFLMSSAGAGVVVGFPNPEKGDENTLGFAVVVDAGLAKEGKRLVGGDGEALLTAGVSRGAENMLGFVTVVDKRGGVFGRGEMERDLSSFGDGEGEGICPNGTLEVADPVFNTPSEVSTLGLRGDPSSSDSSFPEMGALVRGELRTGRVEGRPSPKLNPVGRTDDGAGIPRGEGSWAGEPGGVVLFSLVKGLGCSLSAGPGVDGGEGVVRRILGVGDLRVNDGVLESGRGTSAGSLGVASPSSSSSSSSPAGSSSSSSSMTVESSSSGSEPSEKL